MERFWSSKVAEGSVRMEWFGIFQSNISSVVFHALGWWDHQLFKPFSLDIRVSFSLGKMCTYKMGVGILSSLFLFCGQSKLYDAVEDIWPSVWKGGIPPAHFRVCVWSLVPLEERKYARRRTRKYFYLNPIKELWRGHKLLVKERKRGGGDGLGRSLFAAPDRPFHNFGASKNVVRRFRTT